MIYIGTDIVSISRIEKNINNQGKKFLNHIFTRNEQVYCESKSISKIHYSGKFAAKEAVKKAILSSKLQTVIPLKNIEIVNNSEGAPSANIIDLESNLFKCQISISHIDEYAIAFAILINDPSII